MSPGPLDACKSCPATSKYTNLYLCLQLFNLNGATYEGFRAYIRFVKDFGFPDKEGGGPVTDVSRLPTTESLQPEVSLLRGGQCHRLTTTSSSFRGRLPGIFSALVQRALVVLAGVGFY